MARFLVRCLVLAGCLGMFSSPTLGYAADLKAVVATLELGYRGLTDLSADFYQRTTIAALKREERGGGELFLKRPAWGGTAMFRFDYTKPKQQIVSNGRKVWYYLPENRQVIVADVASLFEGGGNSVAFNYLTGLGTVSRDFTITFAGRGRDRKGNYVLDLVPKKPTPILSRLQLTISAAAVEQYLATGKPKELFPVVSSLVFDQGGNRTLLEYRNVRVNRGLGAERFTFKVPAGVEVIKNR